MNFQTAFALTLFSFALLPPRFSAAAGEVPPAPAGNLGVLVLVRIEGDAAHFRLITLWESLDAIRRFAGDPVDAAKYYPEDKDYLLEFPSKVEHYEVASVELDNIPASFH